MRDFRWPWSRNRSLVIVLAAGLILAETLACMYAEKVPSRYFKDDADIGLLMERTQWVPTPDGLPYRDVFQEYPPFGAYYLSLPRFLSNTPEGYARGFYFLSGLVLLGLFVVIVRRLPENHVWYALLVACPSVLFYGINRYDALPALVFLLCVLAFWRGQDVFAAVLFGVACGVKWYPIAALPIFFALAPRRWRFVVVAGASTIICCLHPVLYAPAERVWESYVFHMKRGASPGSIYDILGHLFPRVVTWDAWVKRVLFFLQFLHGLLAGVVVWRRKITCSDVHATSALMFAAVAGFTFFAKFHSPQWHVWIVPFAVLAVSRTVAVYFIIADGLLYITVPLVWNLQGPGTMAMISISAIYFVMLGYAVVYALRLKDVPGLPATPPSPPLTAVPQSTKTVELASNA